LTKQRIGDRNPQKEDYLGITIAKSG